MGKTVLIVEDDFLLGMELERVMSQHGWRVIGPATTTAQALRLLNAERPDAAVLDVLLQDGLVTPVASRLRALGVPCIIVSGRKRPEGIAADLRGLPNFTKPIDHVRLVRSLALLTGTALELDAVAGTITDN
jgi:two-component system, response regulator PdtaR